ncbi:hypothetical protein BDA96_02G127200 [Sorghum bicolor]|uniref:Uncharacterized protein n=1 Tax=Sorghum bicolor TaxID=4558 RepID=A0A921RM01_SORBI|nr:hypothetical protein BDA96_02G127200 [Sorghum bicolor]
MQNLIASFIYYFSFFWSHQSLIFSLAHHRARQDVLHHDRQSHVPGGRRIPWHGGLRSPTVELVHAACQSSRPPAQPTRACPRRSSRCARLRTSWWTRDGASRDRAVDLRRRRSRPVAWRLAPTRGVARAHPRRSSRLRHGGARACPRSRLMPAHGGARGVADSGRRGGLATGHLVTERWTRDGGGRARRHGGSRPLAVKLAPACDGARACGMAELTLARVADLRQPGGDGSACPYAGGARDGWWRSSRVATGSCP